jgi:DNA-binding FadR family transcriptional regulator
VSAAVVRTPGAGGRLSEGAQQAIREYILAHGLRPNDPLPPEARLAEALGVSRTAVREAVKALESVGVLESRNGVGLFVRPFSFDPILDNRGYGLLLDRAQPRHLLQVREQLEAGFVVQVAGRATAAQLRVLRSVVDRMGQRAARGEGFAEEDRFFHRTLYDGIGNPLLIRLLDIFWLVARRLREENRIAAGADPVAVWEDHRRIVEALEAADAAAAGDAMRHHFLNITRRLEDAGDEL